MAGRRTVRLIDVLEPYHGNLALQVQICARVLADRELRAAAAESRRTVRSGDQYLLQYLERTRMPTATLAARAGISPQGASKAVIDLERRGLVVRSPGMDRRSRWVELTGAGAAVLTAAAAVRREFDDDARDWLGPRHGQLVKALGEVVDLTVGLTWTPVTR